MDERMGEMVGAGLEVEDRVTSLEHRSWGPDAWTVVDDWEQRLEREDGEVEEQVDEEEEEGTDVDVMEEPEDEAQAWVRAHPMQEALE